MCKENSHPIYFTCATDAYQYDNNLSFPRQYLDPQFLALHTFCLRVGDFIFRRIQARWSVTFVYTPGLSNDVQLVSPNDVIPITISAFGFPLFTSLRRVLTCSSGPPESPVSCIANQG